MCIYYVHIQLYTFLPTSCGGASHLRIPSAGTRTAWPASLLPGMPGMPGMCRETGKRLGRLASTCVRMSVCVSVCLCVHY